MKICKENKIKEFYFKLLHRIVVSKKELCYFRVKKDPNSNYCGQVDCIEHTFIECHHTIFQSVFANFSVEHSTTFTLCEVRVRVRVGKTLSTGPLPCKITRTLNYFILFAKYYLYSAKCNRKGLDLH